MRDIELLLTVTTKMRGRNFQSTLNCFNS